MSVEDSSQALVGYRSNEEWQDLLAQAATMVGSLDEIEDQATRDKVFAAMEGIDAVHREALHRLVRLFKDGVLEQVVTDPAINSLMGMYDLLPPETPGCAKVWDFIGDGDDSVPQDQDNAVAAENVTILPHWSPEPREGIAEEGSAYICEMDEGRILLVRVDGVDYALEANCPNHKKPFSDGRLDNVLWHCSEGPGCSYDVRDGKRLGGGQGLQCFPVRVEDDGQRMIGFGIPFEPKLPAF